METTSTELIPIVDPNDNVITHKERGTLNNNKDIYRVSGLWVTSPDGQVLLAQRGFHKRNDPGKFAAAVCGTVEKGETHLENITKEAEEELGLTDLEIKGETKVFLDRKYKYFPTWYTAAIDRGTPLTLEDSIESIRWFELDELRTLAQEQPELFVSGFYKRMHAVGFL